MTRPTLCITFLMALTGLHGGCADQEDAGPQNLEEVAAPLLPPMAKDCGTVEVDMCLNPDGEQGFPAANATQQAAFDCLLDAGAGCEAARLFLVMPMNDFGVRILRILAVVPDEQGCHYMEVEDTGEEQSAATRFMYRECSALEYDCVPVDPLQCQFLTMDTYQP